MMFRLLRRSVLTAVTLISLWAIGGGAATPARAAGIGLDAGRPTTLVAWFTQMGLLDEGRGRWLRLRMSADDSAWRDAGLYYREHNAMQRLREGGWKLCWFVRWDPKTWANGVRPGQRLPLDLREAYERCRHLARAYGDAVDAWEIDNEPDLSFVPEQPETYVAFLKACRLGLLDESYGLRPPTREATADSSSAELRRRGRSDGLPRRSAGSRTPRSDKQRAEDEGRAAPAGIGDRLLVTGSASARGYGGFVPSGAEAKRGAGRVPMGAAVTNNQELITNNHARGAGDTPRLWRWLFRLDAEAAPADNFQPITNNDARTARVIMAPLAFPPGTYFERFVANDGLSYTDGFNFHYYGYPEDFTGVYRQFERAVSAAAERRAPRAVIGYSLLVNGAGATPAVIGDQLLVNGGGRGSSRFRTLPVFVTEFGYASLGGEGRNTVAGREEQMEWFRAVTPQMARLGIEAPMAFYLPPYFEVGALEFGLLRAAGAPPAVMGDPLLVNGSGSARGHGGFVPSGAEAKRGAAPAVIGDQLLVNGNTALGAGSGRLDGLPRRSAGSRTPRSDKQGAAASPSAVMGDPLLVNGSGSARGYGGFVPSGAEAKRGAAPAVIGDQLLVNGAAASPRAVEPATNNKELITNNPGRTAGWRTRVGQEIRTADGGQRLEVTPALAWVLDGQAPYRKTWGWRVPAAERSPVVLDFVGGAGVRASKPRLAHLVVGLEAGAGYRGEGQVVLYNFGGRTVRGRLHASGPWEVAEGAEVIALSPGERRVVPVTVRLPEGDGTAEEARMTWVDEAAGAPPARMAAQFAIEVRKGPWAVQHDFVTERPEEGALVRVVERPKSVSEPPLRADAGWAVQPGTRVERSGDTVRFVVEARAPGALRRSVVETPWPAEWGFGGDQWLRLQYRMGDDSATAAEAMSVHVRTANGNLYEVWPRHIARKTWRSYLSAAESFSMSFYNPANLPWRLAENRPVALVLTFYPNVRPAVFEVRGVQVGRFGRW